MPHAAQSRDAHNLTTLENITSRRNSSIAMTGRSAMSPVAGSMPTSSALPANGNGNAGNPEPIDRSAVEFVAGDQKLIFGVKRGAMLAEIAATKVQQLSLLYQPAPPRCNMNPAPSSATVCQNATQITYATS